MACRVNLALSDPRRSRRSRDTSQSPQVPFPGDVFGTFRGHLLTSLLLLLLTCGQFRQTAVDALSCEPCDDSTCSNVTDCPGGMVLGPCRCCYECARQENQTCGGLYDLAGTCDHNLICVIPVSEDAGPDDGQEGICMAMPEVDCSGHNCPPAFTEHLCPPDSSVVFKSRKPEYATGGADASPRHQEEPAASKSPYNEAGAEGNIVDRPAGEEDPAYHCVCNTSACHVPTCARGDGALRLLQNATGLPGTCCDVYECQRPADEDCPSMMCPPIEEDPCPEDSVRLTPMWTDDHCCELQQGCACPAENRCEEVECPAGYLVEVISEANGLPGSCCTRFRCIPERLLTCRHNGKEMKNGEIWQADQCRTCECSHGVSKCTRKSCPQLSCTYMVIPEGECCPVCRGCVSTSGRVYNESETWMESNDCTTCRCNHGRAECQAEMCVVECLHPKRVPGQCCPVCEETCNIFCPFGFALDAQGLELCECATEDKCAAFRQQKCDKTCEYGFKTTRDGCIKCKCNKCPHLNCTKRCTHGHVLNDESCPLCKCKESYSPDLLSSEHQRADGKACLSVSGSKHLNGESWSDGCRKCYCHNGLEMCSLLACPAPLCSNPVFKVGDCCPTCPGLTVPGLEGEKERCQSAQGHYYVEGETWQMDACTLCVCHGGAILCQTPTCPPVVCHHPVRPEGLCCATCRGDDLSSLPVTGHHHCRSHTAMMYKHGETWQSTPCQSCTCLDGQILCYNQMCPPVSCKKTLFRKGQCCPTCVDSTKPQVCIYNDVTYESGEKWQGDNCTQCMCINGHTECFPLPCPNLDCTFGVIKRIGQCCQECYEAPKSEFLQGHNKSRLTQDIGDVTTAVSSDDESGFDAKAFGFSMLAVTIIAIIGIIILARLLIKKSKRYHTRPNDPNIENQKTLIQSEKEQYWQKFTSTKTPETGKGNRSSNDYAEMVFSDSSKGNYKSSVIS